MIANRTQFEMVVSLLISPVHGESRQAGASWLSRRHKDNTRSWRAASFDQGCVDLLRDDYRSQGWGAVAALWLV